MSEREVIVIDPQAQARKQFLDEMRAYDKNPIDRAKKPGGYFLNADGSGAHDSEGRPVSLRGEDKDHAEELQRTTKARFSNQGDEVVPMDSPEEVADRQSSTPQAAGGQPFIPPAVEPGVILGQDGAVSEPDKSKKSSRKSEK